MNFRKLKKWFQRHRNDGRTPEDQAIDPARPESKTPASEIGKKTVRSKPRIPPVPERKAPSVPQRKAARTPADRPAAARPLSRQGIPILKPDEDLATHFTDAATVGKPTEKVTGGAGEPAGSETIRRRSAGRSSTSLPKKAAVRRNRVGVRRLDDKADLNDYFLSGASDSPNQNTPVPPAPVETKHAGRVAMTDIPTDRHGIPRLDDKTDLNRLFDDAVDETESREVIGDALRQSLAHDARGLMKKKTDGFFPPRRLSLKEKLRRYPPPQADLDLHGATAAKARQRAEAFIRTARSNGLFTLRVIVGKGLHSEGGAVLPDVVEDLLMALKREDLVLSYRWEKRVKRKSGAVIVFLSVAFP